MTLLKVTDASKGASFIREAQDRPAVSVEISDVCGSLFDFSRNDVCRTVSIY